MPSSAQRKDKLRARPVLEGLEDRRLLSNLDPRHSGAPATASSTGVFSGNYHRFTYITPSGGVASIQLVGLGSLQGTSVDSSRELLLVYGGTNAFSQIYSHVHGGNGTGPLLSIRNSRVQGGGAQLDLSGVGSNVIKSVYLPNFDLVAGGDINLTAGVNTLVLASVSPNSQIHLRTLPPAPTTSTSTTSTLGVVTTESGTTSGAAVRGTTTTTSPAGTTLQARQSTTITNDGVSATYVSGKNGEQTLTAVSGTFAAGANLSVPLPTGQPSQTPPPAPPGVILKINTIEGNTNGPINLLTDPVIFGYDPTKGQVLAFDVNLTTDTATQDTTIPAITVPGDPPSVGLNLGRDGKQLDVLVSSGTTVYAFNATTGVSDGQFTTTNPINGIGSTDNLTLLGSYLPINQIQAINLSASLAHGTEQVAAGNSTYTPTPGFTLLGGLTGLPGSTMIYASVAAYFDTFQPTQQQFGQQSINTVDVSLKGKTIKTNTNLSGASASAFMSNGKFIPVTPSPPPTPPSTEPAPLTPGTALGSIDQGLAYVSGFSNGVNTIQLSSGGTINLTNPDPVVALSQAFRPDLNASAVNGTAPALIDIQGNVESFRGSSANGLVFNDTGNLNLVKFASMTNSTIVGQPVSHVDVPNRTGVIILTPSRTITSATSTTFNSDRNGVTVDRSLQPIGPLSLTND